ncbi:MAG TPA: hypothetical protein VNE63_06045 [Candidatus Acidoferrales bacterium]|nr:hypothetical protein [Candidatus Acidoferrales bacterium]
MNLWLWAVATVVVAFALRIFIPDRWLVYWGGNYYRHLNGVAFGAFLGGAILLVLIALLRLVVRVSRSK